MLAQAVLKDPAPTSRQLDSRRGRSRASRVRAVVEPGARRETDRSIDCMLDKVSLVSMNSRSCICMIRTG
jgi:hypothetical protein